MTLPVASQDELQLFIKSCRASPAYPKNIVQLHHTIHEHNLNAYFEQLDERSDRLFCEEPKASLDIWEYDDQVEEYHNTCVHNEFALRGKLQGESLVAHSDPRCRFIFVHAAHSRDRLKTSRAMLMYVFTYHQVMPAFLDFVFPFGKQEYAEDFQFSGFREDTRLMNIDRGLKISKLGRSGQEIRLCYNLKSVEPSKSQQSWPWSIRQVAVYHSFDIETGKSFWIIIKGDQFMRTRVQSATQSQGISKPESFRTTEEAFTATFAVHLILCMWCSEHWRWYINFLEAEFQNNTRHAMAVTVEKRSAPAPQMPIKVLQPLSTPARRRTFGFQKAWTNPGSMRMKSIQSSLLPSPPPSPPLPLGTLQTPFQTPPAPPPPPPQLPPGPPYGALDLAGTNILEQEDPEQQEEFSFEKLQHVQFIEDKGNEVLLVLDSNVKILNEMKGHYKSIVASEEYPKNLSSDSKCKREIARFEKCISGIVGDLQLQHSRVQGLLRLVAGRKSLLYGILDFRNIEASKLLALRAQQSSQRIERMTEDMNQLAEKTKQETVSMRIITLVTLFFLPGTFMSTIMSTDIVKFQVVEGQSQEVFSLGALQLYLAITLPMIVVTFGAWYGVYWWVERKQQRNPKYESN